MYTEKHTQTHTHKDKCRASKHNLKCKCNKKTRGLFENGGNKGRAGGYRKTGGERGNGEEEKQTEHKKIREKELNET